VTNTFPLFFSKLNRTAWHVNMPGRHALSAHEAGKLIVNTDRQTKTERHVCKIVYRLPPTSHDLTVKSPDLMLPCLYLMPHLLRELVTYYSINS
jgi:hypothetical protein